MGGRTFHFTKRPATQAVRRSVAGGFARGSLLKQEAWSDYTIGVYLEYIDSLGDLIRIPAAKPTNSEIGEVEATTHDFNVPLPAEAVRLVRLVITQESWGEILLDSISLSITGAAIEAVPQISSVKPAAAPYGHNIVIRGKNFGAGGGQVWLHDEPVDYPDGPGELSLLDVSYWSSTQIVARTHEPQRAGRIAVVNSDGVPCRGYGYHSITSPHYIVQPRDTYFSVIPGEDIYAAFNLLFMNGFVSTSGVTGTVTEPDTLITTAMRTPRQQSGTYALKLDTSAVTNGVYNSQFVFSSDQTSNRLVNFTMNVQSVTGITFSVWDDVLQESTTFTSLNITNQTDFWIDTTLHLSDGSIYFSPSANLPYNVTSSNPAVVLVTQGTMGYEFWAVGTGSTTLNFESIDGFTAGLDVSVSFPDGVYMDPAFSIPGILSNNGNQTNTFFWQGHNQQIDWHGYYGNENFGTDNYESNKPLTNFTWWVRVDAGTTPGTYIFYANQGGSSGAERPLLLTVTNAGTHGQISGRVFNTENSGHGASGEIVFYDSTTGDPAATNDIWSMHDSYLIGYIQPGSYKLAFISQDQNWNAVTNWYGPTNTLSDATTLDITAGSNFENIDFFVAPAAAPPQDLEIPAPNIRPDSLDFTTETVAGVEYILEYKTSMTNTEWNVLQQISGDGGVHTLEDIAPIDPNRFYRIRMLRQ